MFNYFTGTVKYIYDNTVVLETAGIGYEFTVSRYCVNNLKQESSARLFAYLSVSDNGIGLYGFYSSEEKAMFLRLISISGIGAKVAIGILSGLSLNQLSVAIASGDSKLISTIKGVGKKTAERIVLELRDKLGEELQSYKVENSNSDIKEEAILALMALGFNKNEATTFIKGVEVKDNMTVEDVVMAALKRG